MDVLPYLLIAVAGLFSGILSGIGGGGGGMLMIPAFIFVGLPPQVAVATGKMNGLGASFGGLLAFSKTGNIRKDIVRPMIPITIIIGITTPFIFNTINSNLFQLLLGVILILLLPTLFIKSKINKLGQLKHKRFGYIAYTGVLSIQAVFGSGVGTLANFVLILLFGTTKLEANATKRAITAVLTPITFVALLLGGYVNLLFGLIGLVTVFIGSSMGSKLAVKHGEDFATYGMAVLVSLSAVILVVQALA